VQGEVFLAPAGCERRSKGKSGVDEPAGWSYGNGSKKQKRQIKKVPSDPSNNSFTNRHARSEHGMLENRCLLPPLPAPAFGQHGSILGRRPANSQLEACISTRPFTPPQRLSSFENRLGGIAAPGLCLRSRPELFLKPVRLGTRLLFRFRRLGRVTAPDPLPDSESSTSGRSPASTPLQDFHPSGSQCSTDDLARRSLP
jgi:hypothetical protein